MKKDEKKLNKIKELKALDLVGSILCGMKPAQKTHKNIIKAHQKLKIEKERERLRIRKKRIKKHLSEEVGEEFVRTLEPNDLPKGVDDAMIDMMWKKILRHEGIIGEDGKIVYEDEDEDEGEDEDEN